MAKFQCTICGQIHEGLEAPEKCPVCKAPSSKFTVIDKGAQKATKLQKINEEDYEIIKKLETDGYVKAVEWYQENYDCELDEAKDAIKAIREKYNVHYNGAGESDEDSIIEKYESTNDIIQVVRWYKEKHDLGLKEAKDKVEEVLNDAGLRSVNAKSGSGCMITILIAITSTLSVFCFL